MEQVARGNRIHPKKFVLWLAMASITMMFAGFTSAYIVREAQGNWLYYKLPGIFWVSTIVIIVSSGTMALSVRAFKKRAMLRYRLMITITAFLGVLFGICQITGFKELYANNIKINGNPSGSFLFIIAGLHLVHMGGGIIALLVMFLLAFRRKMKVYNATGIEIMAGYWHFVDILWIYLFVFFLANQ